MVQVLQELGYLEGATITEKGKIGCQINAGNELIITELLFKNVLASCNEKQFAGVICSLIGDSFDAEYAISNEELD